MGWTPYKPGIISAVGFAVGNKASSTTIIDSTGALTPASVVSTAGVSGTTGAFTTSTTTPLVILSTPGRISTSTQAGASLGIDATSHAYAEGMELRWHMADWADGSTTHTDAKGMYIRMENREANSNGSVYGIEAYGVSNDVANTKNIFGGLFYAYLKGTTACTVTGMYALQPELSFDAGASAHTITEAACVRAKVTGGAMSDYTALHGYKLLAGDMDGGSRTYGNAFWVCDDGDMSGTSSFTKGLYLQAACTTGIDIAGATTTAIATSGTSGSATGRVLKGQMTINAANHGDGYGLVEGEMTLTGTAAGHTAASAFWVNIISGTISAGNYVCAANNGVYEEATGTITNAKVVFGMRAQKILADTDALSFPFSINTNNSAITAVFDVNNHTDMGQVTNAGSDAGTLVPFMRDANGTIKYIKLYDLA